MKNKGWIMTDIIISISIMLLFTIPLANVYKAISYHLYQSQLNEKAMSFLSNSMKSIIDEPKLDLPINISSEDFEFIAVEDSFASKDVLKIKIELYDTDSKLIERFHIYKEVIINE